MALDLIGHGASSRPRSAAAYSFAAIAGDVLRVFDRFARPSNVLIAHSYGSPLPLQHHPPRQGHPGLEDVLRGVGGAGAGG